MLTYTGSLFYRIGIEASAARKEAYFQCNDFYNVLE